MPPFGINVTDMPVVTLWLNGENTHTWKQDKALHLNTQMVEMIISGIAEEPNMSGFISRFLFEDALTKAIVSADANGDGVIDSDEFVTLIRNVQENSGNLFRDELMMDERFEEKDGTDDSKITDESIRDVFTCVVQAVAFHEFYDKHDEAVSNNVMIDLIQQCQLEASQELHLMRLKSLLLRASGVGIDEVFTDELDREHAKMSHQKAMEFERSDTIDVREQVQEMLQAVKQARSSKSKAPTTEESLKTALE